MCFRVSARVGIISGEIETYFAFVTVLSLGTSVVAARLARSF
jgi:hypothetical protein